jgi:ATP-dependent DNA helicase RecQ
LTKTNDEALQITGLLLKNGMQAKLIQSNDGFSLQNLLEVRFLLNEINMVMM